MRVVAEGVHFSAEEEPHLQPDNNRWLGAVQKHNFCIQDLIEN